MPGEFPQMRASLILGGILAFIAGVITLLFYIGLFAILYSFYMFYRASRYSARSKQEFMSARRKIPMPQAPASALAI